MASSPSSSLAANGKPNTQRVSGNRRKTFGGTQPERHISVVRGGQPDLPARTTSLSFVSPSSPALGHSTRLNTSHSLTSRKSNEIATNTTNTPTVGLRECLVSGAPSLLANSAVAKISGSSALTTSNARSTFSNSPSSSLTSSTTTFPTTSSIPIARTRRGSSVSANSHSTTYPNPNSNTHKSSTTKSPPLLPSPSTPKELPATSSSTSMSTSQIARVRTTSTASTQIKAPSQASASSAKSRPYTMSITGTSSASSNASTPPRRGNVKPNPNPSSASSSTTPHSLPFPSSTSSTVPSSALRPPKPAQSPSPSSTPARPRTTSSATNLNVERSNSKRTLRAQDNTSNNRLSIMSRSSAVSSAGSVYSQSSASRSGNGKQKALEDPSVNTGDESEVGQRGKTKASSLGGGGGSLRLDPTELEVLKSVWNKSPVESPPPDPGGTSRTDRHAIKSAYGSVFGFGSVSGSSRKGSVSGNEGSLIRPSSLRSSISNCSATTDSTTGTAPAFPLPTSPEPVPSLPANMTFPSSSSSQQSMTDVGVSRPFLASSILAPPPMLTVGASKINNSLTTRRRLSPVSPTGPRAPKSPSPPRGNSSAFTSSSSPTPATSASNASKSKSTPSSTPNHTTPSKSLDTHVSSRTVRPSTSASSLRTVGLPSGPRLVATATRSRTVTGASAVGTGMRASLAGPSTLESGTRPTSFSNAAASTTSPHTRPYTTSRATSASVPEALSTTRARPPASPSLPSAAGPSVMSSIASSQATHVPKTSKGSSTALSATTVPAVAPSSAFCDKPKAVNDTDGIDGLPSSSPSTSYVSSVPATSSYLNHSNPHTHRSASAPTQAPRVNIPLQAASASQASPSHSPGSHSHPQTVNLKQLLSKPAPPGYTSGGGSASESEGGFVSIASKKSRTLDEAELALRRRREIEAEAATYFPDGREKGDRGREREPEKLLRERERSMSRSRSTGVTDAEVFKEHGMLKSLTRNASWSRSRDRESGEKGEKKQRSVLKRKPSSGNVSLNANHHSTIHAKEFPYSTFAPSYSGPMLPVSGQPASSFAGSRSPSRAGTSPIPPSAQGTRADRSQSPSRALTPSGMTPAEEIMLAYKQQQEREQAREREREERAKEREREREIWRREEEDRAERERQAKEKEAREKAAVTSLASAASSTASSKEKITRPTINTGIHEKEEEKSRDRLLDSSLTTHSYEDTTTNLQSLSHKSLNSPPIPESEELKITPPYQPSYPSPSSELLSKAITRKASSPTEESSGPYYTVFGDTSGRLVAVGSVEDSYSDIPSFSWSSSIAEGLSSKLGIGLGLTNDGAKGSSTNENGAEIWERSSSVTVGNVKSKGFGIGLTKTLSRKMSGRLRGGVVVKKDEFQIVSTSTELSVEPEERGRPSLQERRRTLKKGSVSERVGQDSSRSLRLSIDKYAEKASHNSILTPHAGKNEVSFGSFDLTPLQGSFTVSKSTVEATTPSPLSASHASGGKKKLWNIMKRISTGGLRDKYHSNSLDSAGSGNSSASPGSPPPPVPTLPKDLSVFAKSSKDDESGVSFEAQRRKRSFSQPRTSVATISGSPSPSRHSISSSSTNRPITIPRVPPPPLPIDAATSNSVRPGTATRSSSPVSSSDIASSKFFHRSQSQRSSSSSLGEEIPPLPNVNASSSSQSLHASAKAQKLQQYIIPPSELYKLELNLDKEQTSSRPRRPSLTTTTSKLYSSVSSSRPSLPHSQSHSKQSKSRPSSPDDDWMIVPTPKEERPTFSLPVPHRRRKDAPDGKLQDPDDEHLLRRPPLSDDGRPPSPIIPTFSNAAAINTWGTGASKTGKGKAKSSPTFSNDDASNCSPAGMSEASYAPPPPLPVRNPKRHASSYTPVASSASSSREITPSRKSTSSSVSPPATAPISGNSKAAEDQLQHSRSSRKSIFGYNTPSSAQVSPQARNQSDSAVSPKSSHDILQSPSTSGTRSASSSSPSSASTPNKARVSQIPPPRTPRTPLSEKEKADKWDDLLERSARAGGTLHLTVGTTERLDSDRLRFSVNAENEHGAE